MSDDSVRRPGDARELGKTPSQPPKPTSSTLRSGEKAGVPVELASHDRYRIVRRLGSGGMGDVYLAEHRLMERLVAVKVIRPELIAHPSLVERFQREVKAAAKLAHPNIVTAYDAEQAGGLHFLVMEYVEGVDLAQVMAKHGRLPVVKACHFVRQAALGLQHAFEKGMVHRDIKPQNLMLTPKGQVKILDFGIARFAREKFTTSSPADLEAAPLVPGGTQLTKSGSVVGTADYMAPEQAIDAHQADTRADIYSLGCLFYYLLTGQVPFPGGASVDKIMRHAEERWISPERLRPDVPQEVVAVVNKMMAKNPARRFQTPAEVAKAIEPILRAATAKPTAVPPTTVPPTTMPPKKAATRGPSSTATKVSSVSTPTRARQPLADLVDLADIVPGDTPLLAPRDPLMPRKPQRRTNRRPLIVAGVCVGMTVLVAICVIVAVLWRRPTAGTREVASNASKATGAPSGSPGTTSGAPNAPGSAAGATGPGSVPGAPTVPAGAPTAPAGAPTNPAGAPTNPAGAPTNPAGAPTNPAGAPTNPAGAPAAGKITSGAETIDIPPSVSNPRVKSGDLMGLGRSANDWRSKATELIGVKRLSVDKPVEGGSSWLVPLLPHLGHDDVFQLYDLTKGWHDGKNLLVSVIEIPAFFDPADLRHRWQGFPFHGDGPALTHFVGMSGVEDRNQVAASLPRTDPKAGVFGYDYVARDGEITDGTSNTIMLIGSGTVQSPWVHGGGATIRGAREPYFGELTGFGSKSVTSGGALVVMADGSVRAVSKDIDPAVFRSLCTIHGGEAVDQAKLESTAPRRP